MTESEYDTWDNLHCSKVGGWPYLIQGAIWFWDDAPEYVFQIDTEDEAGWMWGDAGTAYFGRGKAEKRDQWHFDWQCY